MTDQESLVIVGAGLAGAKAAEAARDNGFSGRITLIGDEPDLPYERPPLSKDVLRGKKPPESTNVHDPQFYWDHGIELEHRHVDAIDLTKRVVHAGADRIGFGVLVLATGARARKLTVPGADLENIHYLRTRAECMALADAIHDARRICVIGGGWIGAEVAASARRMGAQVVLANKGAILLGHVMGQTIGNVFEKLHIDNGVEIKNNASVVELRGDNYSANTVVFADGSTEDADLIIAGIGVEPELEVAQAASLLIEDGGVAVDEFLRTKVADIYAVGDIASAWHPFYNKRVRVEHWDNALNQGKCAGANITGKATAYDRLPYFFSDQFNLGMEYVGLPDPDASVVIRGDLEKREFIAFWHRDGVVSSAMNVNVWDVVGDLRKIVQSKTTIDVARLADESVALTDLA